MSKMIVTIDSEAKTIGVSVNGVDIPNVDDVSAYLYTHCEEGPDGEEVEKPAISIRLCQTTMSNDVKISTQYSLGSDGLIQNEPENLLAKSMAKLLDC